MKTSFAAVCLSLALLAAAPANGTVLMFDVLPADNGAIDSAYGGLNWTNFNSVNVPWLLATYPNHVGSGYDHGRVSDNHVAYNANGYSAAVNGAPFDFNGASLTAAWKNGLSVEVDGYLGGALKYSKTVIINVTEPVWCDFSFVDVDRLLFTSFGGTPVRFHRDPPLSDYERHTNEFVMDNFTFNEAATVPEPVSLLVWSLLTSVSAGVVGLKAKKRRAALVQV
jgi:hypothetical protein